MNNEELTLIYGPFHGRAFPIRVAALYGKIPLKNENLTDDIKRTLPFGLVPALKIRNQETGEEQILSQSNAILKYVGEKAGLVPPMGTFAHIRVDEVLGWVEDLVYIIVSTFHHKEVDAKIKARQELIADGGKLRVALQNTDKYLGNKRQYFVGDELTIADLKVFATIHWLKLGVLDGFPKTLVEDLKLENLSSWYDRLQAIDISENHLKNPGFGK